MADDDEAPAGESQEPTSFDPPFASTGPRRSTFTPPTESIPTQYDPSAVDDDAIADALAADLSRLNTGVIRTVEQTTAPEAHSIQDQPPAPEYSAPAPDFTTAAQPVQDPAPWSSLPAPDPAQAVALPDPNERPVRRSLPDDELAHWVDDATREHGPTLDVIEQLESQLALREEEAREFRAWESTMRSIGTPDALAAVEEARPDFTGVLPDIPVGGVAAEPVAPEPQPSPPQDAPPFAAPPVLVPPPAVYSWAEEETPESFDFAPPVATGDQFETQVPAAPEEQLADEQPTVSPPLPAWEVPAPGPNWAPGPEDAAPEDAAPEVGQLDGGAHDSGTLGDADREGAAGAGIFAAGAAQVAPGEGAVFAGMPTEQSGGERADDYPGDEPDEHTDDIAAPLHEGAADEFPAPEPWNLAGNSDSAEPQVWNLGEPEAADFAAEETVVEPTPAAYPWNPPQATLAPEESEATEPSLPEGEVPEAQVAEAQVAEAQAAEAQAAEPEFTETEPDSEPEDPFAALGFGEAAAAVSPQPEFGAPEVDPAGEQGAQPEDAAPEYLQQESASEPARADESEPVSELEPGASTQPEGTAEPEASSEPEATAEPESMDEPESQPLEAEPESPWLGADADADPHDAADEPVIEAELVDESVPDAPQAVEPESDEPEDTFAALGFGAAGAAAAGAAAGAVAPGVPSTPTPDEPLADASAATVFPFAGLSPTGQAPADTDATTAAPTDAGEVPEDSTAAPILPPPLIEPGQHGPPLLPSQAAHRPPLVIPDYDDPSLAAAAPQLPADFNAMPPPIAGTAVPAAGVVASSDFDGLLAQTSPDQADLDEEPLLYPDPEPTTAEAAAPQDLFVAPVPAQPTAFDPMPVSAGEPVPTDTGTVTIPPPLYQAELPDDVDETDRAFSGIVGPVAVGAAGVAVASQPVNPPSGPISTTRIPADEVVLDSEPVGTKIFSLEESGPEPTPVDHRVGRAARLFWLWFSANSSILSIGLGAAIFAVGMSLRQSLISIFVGVALSFIPLGFTTLAGKRSGQPTMITSRATFGLVGNIVPSVLALVTRLFWGAVLLWLFASSIAIVLVGAKFDAGLGDRQLLLISLAVAFLIALLVAFAGYSLLARIQLVLTIVSGALVLGLILSTWKYVNFANALSTPDGDWLVSILTGAVLVFSVVGLLWAFSGSDVARYQRFNSSGPASVWWASFGAALPAFVLIGYGALLSASDKGIASGMLLSPLDTLASMLPGWYPIPLVAGAALSLLSGVIITLYSSGFALQAVGVRLRRQWSVLIAGVLLAIVAIVLTFGVTGGMNEFFRDVATTIAVPTAAWIGLFGAEIMIRRRRFESQSLTKRGGVYQDVRWVNLIALLVISAIGLGLTTATVTWLSWQGYALPLIGIPVKSALAASDFGVLVALLLGLIVPLVAGIPAIRAQEVDRTAVASAKYPA